jgi:PIN domain nuclease of toxin-antitoxin system
MLLLDTHAYYWFITDSEKLPTSTKEMIETEEHVFVSIASFWEMAIKESLGKLQLPATIKKLMEDCTEYEFSILPVNGMHLNRIKELPFIHRDPFDRMLICQAQEEDLTIVTVDSNIVKYDVKTIWDSGQIQ